MKIQVNRFEIIDHTKAGEGRAFVKREPESSPFVVETDIQDEGRTLKIFLRDKE